ncbi:MAG: oligosaccharide flippase family protein [Nanoarchaeota archaeon]
MKWITGLILWFYAKFFGEPNERVERFVNNLGIFGLGFVLAKVFSLGFQIYVGRTLGPAVYGDLSLIIAMAGLFFIPMLFGIDTAMVKYVSSEQSEKKKIISSGLPIITIFIVASVTVLWLLGDFIAPFFSVSSEIFVLAIILSLGYAVWITFKDISQGLLQIKKTALMELVWAISSVVLVFAAFTLYSADMFYAFLAIFIGYILASFVMLPEIIRNVRVKYVDSVWAKRLVKYGAFSLLVMVSATVLINMDKVFVGMFLGSEAVGIYKAYSLMTTMVTLSLLTIFATVFFPESSMHENKSNVMSKLWKIFKFLPIYYFGMLFVEYLVVNFGYGYSIDFIYLLIFPLAACVMVPFTMNNWFAASIGQSGIKLSSYAILSAAIINIVLNIYLIPIYGIEGAIISTIIAYFVPNLFLMHKLKSVL